MQTQLVSIQALPLPSEIQSPTTDGSALLSTYPWVTPTSGNGSLATREDVNSDESNPSLPLVATSVSVLPSTFPSLEMHSN
jgi:hypothetical protein